MRMIPISPVNAILSRELLYQPDIGSCLIKHAAGLLLPASPIQNPSLHSSVDLPHFFLSFLLSSSALCVLLTPAPALEAAAATPTPATTPAATPAATAKRPAKGAAKVTAKATAPEVRMPVISANLGFGISFSRVLLYLHFHFILSQLYPSPFLSPESMSIFKHLITVVTSSILLYHCINLLQ